MTWRGRGVWLHYWSHGCQWSPSSATVDPFPENRVYMITTTSWRKWIACGLLLIRLLLDVAKNCIDHELSSFQKISLVYFFFFSQDLLGSSDWHVDPSLADCMKSPLMRLCTKYVICFVHRVNGVHVSGRGSEEGSSILARVTRPRIHPVY